MTEWWSRVRPPRLDAALAAGVGATVLLLTQLVAVAGTRPLFPGGALLVAVAALALVWRRRWPIPVLAATVVALMPYYSLGFPDGPAAVLVVIAMYTVASRLRWPVAAGVGIALLVVWVGAEQIARGPRLDTGVLDHIGWVAAVVAVGIAVGAARWARTATVAHYAEQAHLRVEQERLRMAREVHDVVSHSLAMINVQAGVAAHVADRRPEQALAALLEIKEASRVALADLRATLDVLHTPGAPSDRNSEEAPTPGLHRLTEVVRAGEAAGLLVTVRGDPGPLPAPVNGAAYRIVQEAVTNAVRHAHGARHLTIDLDRDNGSLHLRVHDDGAAPTPAAPGHGLRGITERAAALGGHAHARPSKTGFLVEAEVPVPSEP